MLTSLTQEGTGESIISCAYGTNDVASGPGRDGSIDLSAVLVDGSYSYISDIPADPRSSNGVDTGYDICHNGSGTAIVTAPDAEDNQTIAVPASYTLSSTMNASIGLTGSDVDLTWDDVSMPTYEVWRGTYAYFEPGDSYSTLLNTTASTSYIDTTAAVGDANTNHFYLVQAKDSNGNITYVSSRVGEFDFTLTPGDPGTPKYNTIGIPLITSQFSNASELATAFGGSIDVAQVLRWREDTQTFEAWIPAISFGTNFEVELGDSVYIHLLDTADSNFSLFGSVSSKDTIEFDLDHDNGDSVDIMIPLQFTSISDAEDLAIAVAGSTDNITNILRYDPELGFVTYDPDDIFSTNFSVSTGHHYMIGVNDNTPETWP